MRYCLEDLEQILPAICSRETSSNQEGWTDENRFYGHCAIVALIVQDLFGGEILRASLEGTPFASMRSHYWNRLPDGREKDLSRAQFGANPPELHGQPRSREEILDPLKNTDTVRRYTRLKLKLATVQDGKRLVD